MPPLDEKAMEALQERFIRTRKNITHVQVMIGDISQNPTPDKAVLYFNNLKGQVVSKHSNFIDLY